MRDLNERRRPSPSARRRRDPPRRDPEQLSAIAEIGYEEYLHERFDRARVVFEGLASLAPRNGWFLRALGETCLAQGDLAAALRAANGVIALEPELAESYALRGRVLLAAERKEHAKKDLVRAAHLGDELAAELVRTL